ASRARFHSAKSGPDFRPPRTPRGAPGWRLLRGLMANEVVRRGVHMSGVVFPAAYLAGILTYRQLRLVFVLGSVFAVVLEALRLFAGLEWRLYDALTRQYVARYPAGYAPYAVASTAVVVIFEPTIALPAMLMLMIADPISGLLGSDELRPTKAASVIAVTFIVCLAIALPFVAVVPAIFGSVAATVADGVKPVL